MDTFGHLLDSCICRPFLKLNTSSCRDWASIFVQHDFRSHFPWSLLTVLCLFTSQTSLSHSKLHPQGFVSLDQVFLHLVRVLILLFHAFDLTFWDFLKILGFSKLMKLLWNFWDGLCIFDLKTSCIASHLHYNYVSCILRCVFPLLQTCVLVGLD